MNDECRVIDIKSRKPFAQARAEERKARRASTRRAKKEVADAVMEHRECLVEVLEQTIKMVRAGHLEGLVLIARDTQTKFFLTQLELDERIVTANDLHSYVGVMETLKLELADAAAATAPALLLGGAILDPKDQPPVEEWDDE